MHSFIETKRTSIQTTNVQCHHSAPNDTLEIEIPEVADMEEEILFESELRGAMNSIELAIDRLYQNINERACQMARTDIMISHALLRANLEILHDRKGRTLVSHVAGEAVILCRCKPVEVKIRHDERKCCKELSVWSGKNFSTPAYVQLTSKRVSSICTPRVCNGFDTPLFSIGSSRISK